MLPGGVSYTTTRRDAYLRPPRTSGTDSDSESDGSVGDSASPRSTAASAASASAASSVSSAVSSAASMAGVTFTTASFAAPAQLGLGAMGRPYKPERVKIEPIHDAHHEHLYQAQCADLTIAQDIGAMAGMPPLDATGNVHQGLWAPKLFPMHVGQLTDSKQVAKSMWNQIDHMLEHNKAMINEVDDMNTVPDWNFNTIKAHEEKLKQHTHRVYDISPAILASMRETMFRVRPHLSNMGLTVEDINDMLLHQQRQMLSKLSAAQKADLRFVNASELVLRFLFRSLHTRNIMVTIAGRIMNKHEVCNRAGSWASTKTRHDLTRDIDEAIIRLWDDGRMGAGWIDELRDELRDKIQHWQMLDHTAHQ